MQGRAGGVLGHRRRPVIRPQAHCPSLRHALAGAQLPGFPAAFDRTECECGRPHGSQGPVGADQPVGSPHLFHPRLGCQERCRLFHGRVPRAQHGGRPGRGAGLPGSRCPHPEHRGVHGRHLQCPALHECAARSGQRQACGGSQSRPQTCRQRRRADTQRHHCGQRRCVRCGAAPRGCRPGALVRRTVFSGQMPGIALQTGWQAPGHHHQRWGPRCAVSRLDCRAGAGTGPPVARRGRRAQTQTGTSGNHQRSDRPGRRCQPRVLHRSARGGRQRQPGRRSAVHPFAQNWRRCRCRGPDTGQPQTQTAQALAGLLDGRLVRHRCTQDTGRSQHSQLPHARSGGGGVQQHRLVLPEPADVAANAAPAVVIGQA